MIMRTENKKKDQLSEKKKDNNVTADLQIWGVRGNDREQLQ